MFQVPWFLVELTGDHLKSHQIVHPCDVIDINESNGKINFKRKQQQQQVTGYIISASENRSHLEQIWQAEREKTKQTSTLTNTKHSKNSKWFIIQYQKSREQAVVHEVVSKNDLVWSIENGLKTATGMGEDVFIREGDALRLANIVYIANSYDVACDKMHEIKAQLDGLFFKKSTGYGEWFLLQYSTNRRHIMYGIFNRSITIYQNENKNSNFAYMRHPHEKAVIQGAVIQRSTNIDNLYESIQKIRNTCLNIEFIQNLSKIQESMGRKDKSTKRTKTTSIDSDVLSKIISLEKVMFKESKQILNVLNDIDTTTQALEKEIQILEEETGQYGSEIQQILDENVNDEQHMDSLPALREIYAQRVEFFRENNDINGPLRLEGSNKRLNRISENQAIDYDILARLNKILCDIKNDMDTTTDEDETTLVNLNLSLPKQKRKREEFNLQALVSADKKYPKRIEGNPALVILGSYGTTLKAIDFDNIPWSIPTAATRTLLAMVFGNDILSTHTLSGKPSPAFHGRERPQKLQLDPLKTADIVHCIRVQCGINERAVRSSITTKCADTAKRLRRRKKDT